MRFENLDSLESLSLFAKQVVDGFIIGIHKSPYHGFSVEFSEHRLYNKGESTRNIDWKLFGRTDKLFVKRYEEETNLRCQLVIDTSYSMYYPNFKNPTLKNPNKILFSIYASAALMNLLRRQKDAVGLSLHNEKLNVHLPAKTTSRHHQLIHHELTKLLSIDVFSDKKDSSFCTNIHQIADQTHARSLIILFTDLLSEDSLEDIFISLNHLRYKKHEVILFHLSEPITEHDLIFENRPYKFIDIETSEELKLNPNDIKDHYKKMSDKFMKEVRLRCLKYKIDLVEIDINKGFEQILASYLVKREKFVF